MLLALWRRRTPALVPGGFDWVDVRDVVHALRAAGARGHTGENYLVPGHRASLAELAQLAAAVRGSPVTHRVAPSGLARAVAPVAEPLVRWTGWPLLPTRESLHALDTFPIVDGAKARRELGHEPRPLRQTLTDLHASFVATGRLRPPGSVQ